MKKRKFLALLSSLILVSTFIGCERNLFTDNCGPNCFGGDHELCREADDTNEGGIDGIEDIEILPEPVEIPYEPYVPANYEMRDISSWELVSEMQTGWNLGNTFDVRARGIKAEMSWGNPRTTFAVMQAVADAGFDAVRLPVTWNGHLGNAPDYFIDEEWLDRVEEVVGYVLTTGMYCILNTHHEDWYYPTYENEEQNAEQLAAIWVQLCERFNDYNEKLIFEGMNEPRLKGTEHEWTGGTPEAHEIINRHNAVFIDTVRNSGGKNSIRHLMVPTYAANDGNAPITAVAEALTAYENDDKIIVSIHAYTPTGFALDSRGIDKWFPNTQHEWEIDWMFGRLKDAFLDKGIPVIIGETAAVGKDNLDMRVDWARHYFTKAREHGIPAFWWDNGVFWKGSPTEAFGLMDRWQAVFTLPEIVDAIMGK